MNGKCGYCDIHLGKSEDVAVCCGESFCVEEVTADGDCLHKHQEEKGCQEPAEYCAWCTLLIEASLICCSKNYCGEACLANHNEKSEAHSNGEWHKPDSKPTTDIKAVDIQPYEASVNQMTVKLLEEMLADAKSGKLQEAVVVGVLADGDIAYTPTVDFIKRLGALELIKLRWMHNDILHDGQEG